ncbi:hypothetical protein ABH15_07565 [Methanoculleus taiwanensis]|uniref:Uncharacterized protein n=1 Tax=Methanoculleus taiwanensis TaxID=1550565 RepID=A0A498H124_9EURY|nr:hypothetical protein [Methanoculleus taiwanensis]RXE56044.1 hypothetical protein ABH15_07565 [Methanoculleus taiwanensis]
MQSTDRIDGSPRNEACDNIDSCGTARNSSASEGIRSTAIRTLDPVPLYLIPQTISAAVRRHGRSILEIRAKLNGHNFFVITITLQEVDCNE